MSDTTENNKLADNKEFEFYKWLAAQQTRQDNEDRDNPWVRIHAVLLIEDLQSLIMERAGAMLVSQGKSSDIFAVDKAGEILLWQLVEYLCRVHYARDDEAYLENCRYSQLDREHACSWFEVDQFSADGPGKTELRAPTGDRTQTPSLVVTDY